MKDTLRKMLSRSYHSRYIALLIVISLIIGLILPVGAYQTQKNNQSKPLAITWDVTMNFVETGGKSDNCVFGEAPDANDGPPADIYDQPKPPTPPPSYIRTWFYDNLPVPYNLLLKDYRSYPDVSKTWDLYSIWYPSDMVTPTTITLTWSTDAVNNSEYNTVILYDVDNSIQIANMKLQSSFVYPSPALTTRHFQILCSANSPPYTPSNPNPSNHATNVAIDTDLNWTGGDPNGDSVTYDVFFGTTNPPPLVSANQTSTLYDPGTLDFSTTYYWKIISWDVYGAQTNGPLWDFTTKINNPPYIPSNPSPANSATNIDINADLSWTGGDPDGDNVTYDVYFGTTNPPPKTASNITANTYDPGILNLGTLYYWKISSWDEYGANTQGPVWSFTTITNSPPYIPSNPIPANHASNVPINTDLSWTGGDPDGDTVYYDVYFGDSASPPLVSENQLDTTYDPGTLDPDSKYYWQIISEDIHGSVTPGPLWDFTTYNNPPLAPHNPIPPNGATGCSVNTILQWEGGDPDPTDTVTYDVYFGTTNPPPKVIGNQTPLTYFPGTLAYETKYYWKIIAWDNHGASTDGPLWEFTTLPDPPIVDITKPQVGKLYFLDTILLYIFPTTLIIGRITIEAEVRDDMGVEKVEFYIDNQLRYTDLEAPYEWLWDELMRLRPYEIKVIAYDVTGNTAQDTIEVWKFL